MIVKMVDGQSITCTAEEEAKIRAEWAANDSTGKARKDKIASHDALNAKYPDILQAIDAIYVKLGMSPPVV